MADYLRCCRKKHKVEAVYRLQDYNDWDWYFIQSCNCAVCLARLFGVFKFDEKDRRHPVKGADQIHDKKIKIQLKMLVDGRMAEKCPETPTEHDKAPTRGESHAGEWSRNAKRGGYVLKWLRMLKLPFYTDVKRGGRGANYG